MRHCNSHRTNWEVIGQIGVDAGCLLIADPCYVWQQEQSERYEQEVCDDWGDHKTLKFPGGHAVASGLGDGVYPVEVRYEDVPGWGRRVAEVRVRFLPHSYFGGGE
jgi:hypothetical protein